MFWTVLSIIIVKSIWSSLQQLGYKLSMTVADPGFDLGGGGVEFVNAGGALDNHWKCWRLKYGSFLACVGYISVKKGFRWNTSKASENNWDNLAFAPHPRSAS